MFFKSIAVFAGAVLVSALKLSGVLGGDAPAALIIVISFLFTSRLGLLCALSSGFFLDLFSPFFGVHMVLYSLLSLVVSVLAETSVANRSVGAFLALATAASAAFGVTHAFVALIFSGTSFHFQPSVPAVLAAITNFFGALITTTIFAALGYGSVARFAPQRRAFLILGRS